MEEGDGHAGGIAETIRAWRQRRGWTQEELSHASGLSTRAIRSLERGRTLKPRRTTVQMLADALQVPRARLMGTARRPASETEPDAVLDDTSAVVSVGDQGSSVVAGVPRELPPDLGNPALEVREVVAKVAAGPTGPYRAAIVRVEASEVAIRAAHHVSAKFPDGQLYANLGGSPADPSATLRRFLRSLRAPERPADASLDELAAAFRSALAGHRILVVLDRARSESQISPLIPAEARCALLVAFTAEGRPESRSPLPKTPYS